MDYKDLTKLLASYFFRVDQLHKSEKLNKTQILELRAKIMGLKAKVKRSKMDPFLKKEIASLELSIFPEAPKGFISKVLGKKAQIPDYRKEISILREKIQKIMIFMSFQSY
jgi:hypothetical protein